jgi:two-component system, OmpR family, sensor kinase
MASPLRVLRRPFARFGIRDRLLAAIIVTLAVALACMTFGFSTVLLGTLTADADSRLYKLAQEEASMIVPSGAGITLPKPAGALADLGSQVWVFAAGQTVSGPTLDPDITAAAKSLYGTSGVYYNVPEHDVRLFSVDLTYKNEKIGTIVTGVLMSPIYRLQRVTLIATAGFAAVLLLMVGFVGRWVLGAAFRPVAKMTAEAEAWSIQDLDRRFDMGDPHDELTQLAHTLDGMLDRLAASLRREQRFSAEVSHQLRTPVAKIKAEAELALRRPRDPEYYQEALGSVLYSADQMARTVEALLAAAQEEGSLARGRAEVWQVMADVVSSIGVLAEENGVDVRVQPPARDLRVGVERAIAAQILQPVVENACRFARSQVLLGAGRNGKEVYLLVEDDGPGVAEDERERIFEPGVRGTAAAGERNAARGAGLGLPLARRLARAASGDVEIEDGKAGARFKVRLPAP